MSQPRWDFGGGSLHPGLSGSQLKQTVDPVSILIGARQAEGDRTWPDAF